MAFTRGDFGEYDFNRMVVLFTMKNDQDNVACAISTDAMHQLEGSSRTPGQRRGGDRRVVVVPVNLLPR
jgi:Protein of unknown function (DUF1488)